MPFDPISLGFSAVGAIGSAIEGRKSAKAMRAAMAEQNAILRRQQDLAEKQYGIYEDEYNRFDQTYSPMEKEILDISRTIARPDYEGVLRRATSDYTKARDQTHGEQQRTYARMGVDPSNPMAMRGVGRTNVADALALSTARNMAREAERTRTQNLGFDARRQAYGMGASRLGMFTNNPATAFSGLNTAQAGFGQQAQTYGTAAGGAYGATGYFMNNLANAGSEWWKNRPPQVDLSRWRDPYAGVMSQPAGEFSGTVSIGDTPI